MKANPEYERMIKSHTARALTPIPEALPELRRIYKRWHDYLIGRRQYLHVFQEQLEEIGYAIDPISRQSKINSEIEAFLHLLDSPMPVTDIGMYVCKRLPEFETVVDKVVGCKCVPETDAEVRLKSKLEALELWGPFFELCSIYLTLISHTIEIIDSATAIQELDNQIIQDDYSLAQGVGEQDRD